jgi:hypothetical protein
MIRPLVGLQSTTFRVSYGVHQPSYIFVYYYLNEKDNPLPFQRYGLLLFLMFNVKNTEVRITVQLFQRFYIIFIGVLAFGLKNIETNPCNSSRSLKYNRAWSLNTTCEIVDELSYLFF